MAPDEFTIGQLAEAAGVPVSTLRYYERRGLLRPDHRTSGNYRVYGPEEVERVRFIRAAQEGGFTLDDIANLLGLMRGDQAPCGEVRGLIEARLETVQERLGELKRLAGTLEQALELCRAADPAGACQVVDGLRRAEPPGPGGRKKSASD